MVFMVRYSCACSLVVLQLHVSPTTIVRMAHKCLDSMFLRHNQIINVVNFLLCIVIKKKPGINEFCADVAYS